MPKFFLRSEHVNGGAFLRRLSILLNAGLPLGRALDSTCGPSGLAGVSEKVKSGSPLSDALDPAFFPPSVIAIIRIGERNGDLASGLARACEYMQKKDSFRKKLVASLMYPAFVLVLCAAAMVILVSVLLPAFAGIFNSIGVPLPPISRFILDSSRFMPLFSALFVMALIFTARYLMSDRGLKLPMIGNFRKKVLLASFFHAMEGSLSSGMNIIDSLELSAGVMNSKMYTSGLLSVSKAVSEGHSLSGALEGSGLFNGTATSLVSAGEQASSLDKVFHQLSVLYEEEIDSNLKTFSSLVEPISTLATGLVVGIIVFAMFMPIIKLISVLGG